MLSKKKILIFGAYGNLGKHFRSINKKKFHFLKAGRQYKSQFKIKYLSDFQKIILKTKPDLILNTIAESNVDKCEQNKKNAIYTNYTIVKEVLSGINKINKKIKIIHISTDQVYSKLNFPRKNKETDFRAINQYSKSKILGEKIIIKHNGIVLRTNFIGKSKNKEFLCDWIYRCVNSNKKFTGYSNIYFNPVHVSTLCKLITKIFLNEIEPGIYNLGSEGHISKYNLIKKFVDRKKSFKGKLIKQEYNYNNLGAKRPLNMIMNTNKIKKNLNIKLPNINTEIKKTLLDFF